MLCANLVPSSVSHDWVFRVVVVGTPVSEFLIPLLTLGLGDAIADVCVCEG